MVETRQVSSNVCLYRAARRFFFKPPFSHGQNWGPKEGNIDQPPCVHVFNSILCRRRSLLHSVHPGCGSKFKTLGYAGFSLLVYLAGQPILGLPYF